MPPKKKQQQIDLSTLPECISSNGIFLCKGKKQRSQKIISKILQDYKTLFGKISRQQVLDHAKQKNIYVDPNTLNDKQKKDPKFMQSICTELTPDVVAKATKSLIDQLNIKIRLELKAQNEKPQQQRPKPILQKKLDQIYLFPTQFFQSASQYESLSKLKQGIKYIIVINPLISWANAPQLPQQPQQGQQPEQQDEQIKQFKQLKSKEQLKQQDNQHNQLIQTKISTIKQFRRQSRLDSEFRNCIIDVVDCQIDPYNEEQSLNEFSKVFISRLSKLNVDYDQFLEWKKERNTVKIAEENQAQGGNQQAEGEEKKQQKKQSVKVEGSTTGQILFNFINNLFPNQQNKNEQDDDIQGLINGFDFNSPIENDQNKYVPPARKDKKSVFYSQNQNFNLNKQSQILEQQIRSKLQYPGLNRYLMPDIPLKSQPLRKLNRSQYIQFLHQNLPYQQFQRRLSLIKFQQILKQTDQQRKYTLSDRVYQQNHDQKSLMRQIYRSLSTNQQAQLITKYNEQNDKLYLVLLYKNNQRRNHTKLWQSTWKVLPNYQSWLKYFKQNQNNYNTQSFYDIDYQKIGHINDHVNVFSIPDGGVMICKKSTIANYTNQFLYGIKNHHLFGLNNGVFYSENKKNQVHHFKTNENQFETQILIGQKMKLRLRHQTGDVIVQAEGQNRRMYTPDGYTVIYEDSSNKNYKILHPTGGISQPNGYINQKGLGFKNNSIQQIPALLRRTQNFQITKRDDNTVMIKDQQKKWIKFYEGTEYLIKQEDGSIQIQKKNLPFVRCQQNGQIIVQIDDLIINGVPNQTGSTNFTFHITYNDGNKLLLQNQTIQITQLLSTIPYTANILTNQFTISLQTQELLISKNQISYTKNGVIYNPTQNQQTFNQNQTIPADHIEPKLFIINSDNTGIEYLSQKQLEYYFNLKSNDKKNNTLTVIENNKHSQNVHIVSRIVEKQEMNPKRISLNHNIDLDIFKSEKYFKEKSFTQRFTVRSLIKHKNLLPEDQLEIEEIKQKKEQWWKRTRKQQNQYGHKPKNDPVIEQLKNDKKIMIQFRKKQLPKIDFEELKNQAISEWKFKEKQHMTLVAQKEEEDKIRMRLSKKKKSYVQDYLPIVQKSKEIFSEAQNYSPAGFYTHYFETDQGKKALAAMPDWVFRPKTAKQPKELDPQIVTQLNNTLNKTRKQEPDLEEQKNQRYDTVDVNLNPIREIYIKPSVFTQRQIDEQRQAFQQQKKAYFYHQKKRKQFNLYGEERKHKLQVKSLLRTQPISQINQKYLITEAPLDKKIKISSMKNKLTSQASSLVQMRKQGPHNTLLKTIDKRNDYNTLLEKRTMMVHADLNDKLQRDILINPIQAQFGYLKQGRSYELKINVKNEDILAQRLVVKKARNINIKVMMNQMGPIALGMSRKIIVQIKASSQFLGRFTDEFEIVSKHQIYKIPITAHILSESQFQNQNVKLKDNVREIQQILKRKTSGLPPIN